MKQNTHPTVDSPMNSDNFLFWYGQEANALMEMSSLVFDLSSQGRAGFETARARFEFARNRARQELEILLFFLNENTGVSES